MIEAIHHDVPAVRGCSRQQYYDNNDTRNLSDGD